jgi:hypothetical protein
VVKADVRVARVEFGLVGVEGVVVKAEVVAIRLRSA